MAEAVLPVTGPTARALAAWAVLPAAPLGGWAAAHLLGVHDMDGRDAAGRPLPVPVCPGRSGRLRPRTGLRLLRSALEEADVVEVDGVLVTSPLRTAFDLARTAPTLWQAVEEVDCVFRDRDPWFLEALAAYAAARPRWVGIDQARRATALATVHSRSRGESWLRLVWVLAAGLPPPLLNTPVRVDDGHLVATPDLLDEASGLAGEYDGRTHRTATQQHADAVRGELMAGVGLTPVRATAVDRGSAPLMARRLLSSHALALTAGRRTWWVAPPGAGEARTKDGARGARQGTAGAAEGASAQRA
jgi:hypothetical protein